MTQPLYAVTILLTYVEGNFTFTLEMRQVVTFNYRELSEHSCTHIRDQRLRWSRGSVLAFGTQVRGFKPGRSRRIFKGK